MTFLLANWKIIAIGLLLAGVFSTGYYNGGEHVQMKWDKAKAEQVAAQLAKNITDNAKLKSLEETKNANLTEIDRLRANNHALWLRLPKATCIGTSATSTDTTPIAGQLYSDVPSSAEEALNGFDRTYANEAYRADKIVEGCRVLNGFNSTPSNTSSNAIRHNQTNEVKYGID